MEPPPTLPPAVVAPPELVAPPAVEFEVSQPGPLPPRVPHNQSLSAMLVGGGSLGLDSQIIPVANGMLTVELGFLEPWGLALDAGLESERRRVHLGGSVSVSQRWATLSLRRAFLSGRGQGLHVSLGVRAVQLAANASGFSLNESRDVLLPAAAANLEWRQPIAGGLFFLIRLDAQLRLKPETFSVDGAVVVTVPAWGIGLQAGVGWNFL